MVYIKLETNKKRLSSLIWIGAAGLALSISAPKGADAEGSPTQEINGLESSERPLGRELSSSKGLETKHLIKSQIKELAGKILLDSQVEVTQPFQIDKYTNFVNVSTPSLTPASGHTLLFANSAANQFIAKFSDGSTMVLGGGSSGGVGTITGVTAGYGLLGGGTSGTVLLNADSSILLTSTAASVTYLTQTNAASTYLTQTSAAATYLQPSSLTATQPILYNSTSKVFSTTPISLSTTVVGILPVGNGGTGLSSAQSATQPILYNSATGVISATPISLSTGVVGTLPTGNGGTGLTVVQSATQPILYNAVSGVFSTTPISLSTTVVGTLPVANGGTNLTAALDDNTLVGNGTTWQSKALPTCTDTGGNHLNYDPSSNAFSCGTTGPSGTTPGGSQGQIQYNNGTFAGFPSFVTASSVTISTVTAILGSNIGATPVQGYVGEVLTAFASATNFPSSTNYGDLTSVAATAGNWDVTLTAQLGTATTQTELDIGVSTTTGNSTTLLTSGSTLIPCPLPTTATDESCIIPRVILKLTKSETIYFKYSATYSVGTPQARGRITAVRLP